MREEAGVEAVSSVLDSGEQLARWIMDRHHAIGDADLVAALIQLAYGDYVAPQVIRLKRIYNF
jgi:hypothetical protein